MTMRLLDAQLADFAGDTRFSGAAAGVHLTVLEDPQLHAYVVKYEARSRTSWHSHERGQLLLCLSGSGLVGTRDGSILEARPGVAVWTDAGDEHWHGASPDEDFLSVAVQSETPGSDSVRWLEELAEADWVRALDALR